MNPVGFFVAGVGPADEGIISRLRRPVPPGITATYIQAYTRPGELALLPYCQGPQSVREALASGRRVVAVNFDPLIALVLELAIAPLPGRELDAAVVRLGDSHKQGIPLRQFLLSHYATTCPACLRAAVADYFIWDREQEAPVAKYLHCPACSWDGRAAVDEEDRQRLAGIPVKGMHYHYVLERLVDGLDGAAMSGDSQRARLESLLGLYSPRNLYALAELTLKIERFFPEGLQQRTLKAVLLDCLDRCSSLTPLPDSPPGARRRGLARPGRFVEHNVWRAFEEAAARLQAQAGLPISGLVSSADAVLAEPERPAGFVGQGLVRDLARTIPRGNARLILLSPPPLDYAVWSLSYLWGAWLLSAQAAAPLLPLVRQRTPDPSWYARVMTGSLRALGSLLSEDGRLVIVLSGERPEMLEALCMAASGAELGVSALVQRGADYRLELSAVHQPLVGLLAASPPLPSDHEPEEPGVKAQPPSLALATIEEAIHAAVVRVAEQTIRQRGEPVGWDSLHSAILRYLAQSGLLGRLKQSAELATEGWSAPALDLVEGQIQAGLDEPVFVRLPLPGASDRLWWLAAPSDLSPALADRVESAAHRVLEDTLLLTEADIDMALCQRFPGALTPSADLVAACLRSYGQMAAGQPGTGYWQIRQEDLAAFRDMERSSVVHDLRLVGRRLHCHVDDGDPFDLTWSRDGRLEAVFAVRWQALLGDVLAMAPPGPGVQPYLVIPGGRSALISFKLAANPAWQRAVETAGWQFVKYRHVRQLLAQEDLDDYVWQTVVGLDPVVERETAQLSLL